MIHHYITKYTENEKAYAESWIQINVLGRAYCFSRKKIEINPTANNLDYSKAVVETDESDPKVIASISNERIDVTDGFRVRLTPVYD